jgi:phage terminase large subunit-like protein
VIGKRAICGLDLSATTDLTSVGFDIPLEGGLYAVLHHSFVPEEKLTERRRKDNVPYDLWIQQGYMTATPGATIDHHFVLDYIVKAYEEHDWPKDMVCFDAALSTWLMQELMDRGFTGIEIAQSYSKLSLPTKDFRAKCYDKKIIHNGDPVLAWAIYNAVTRAGPSENIMLDKAKSKERIDPIACLINAHAMAMLPDNSESPYSEQGLRSLT